MADLSKINFLIVDDMKTMRSIVKQSLISFGAGSFVEAEDGRVAWNILSEENKIDFIVCDWNMPNMPGIELLKKCRGSEKYKNIAFLLVTAEQDIAQVKEAIVSGVDGYIVKPFNRAMFEERLNIVIKKRF